MHRASLDGLFGGASSMLEVQLAARAVSSASRPHTAQQHRVYGPGGPNPGADALPGHSHSAAGWAGKQVTGSWSVERDPQRMLLLEQMHSDVKQLEVCCAAPASFTGRVGPAPAVCVDPHAAGLCCGRVPSQPAPYRAPPRAPMPPPALCLLQEMILTQLGEAEELLVVLQNASADGGGVEVLVVRVRCALPACPAPSPSLVPAFLCVVQRGN